MGSVGSDSHNYLKFEKLLRERGHKLHKYKVINHELFQDIGIIHWRGGWRKYVFQAHPKVDMSIECNEKVNEFIKKLMDEWKKQKQRKG